MSDFEIKGHCDDRFAPVREAFAKNFEADKELGASYAVCVGGEMVVDLWGGHADVARTKAWEKDTIVQVSSSSKIPVSLCGLMLVDRGLIDLDEPVATYWPEFAQAGKEKLPVRYLFSHSSGLPNIDGMPALDVLADWDEVIRRLAAQKPWWEPGTQSGYQSMIYGHLIGELVLRTTGKTISEFFNQEVAAPLDIDFHLGPKGPEIDRIAEIEDNLGFEEEVDKDSIYYRAHGYLLRTEFTRATGTENAIWKLNIPAGNGVGNARSLTRIGSLLARGGVAGGKRYFSEETGKLPYQEQIYTFDHVLMAPVRWGLGFGLASKEIPYPWPHAFHWGGAGGSSVSMVPELGVSWAYVPSKFSSAGAGVDDRAYLINRNLIKCLLER